MPQWRPFKSPLLAWVLALLPVVAMAQSAPPAPAAAGACYEMYPAEANTLPGSPMLINKCTGQTYVLARVPPSPKGKPIGGQTYRWMPIGMSDGPEVKPGPAAAPAGRKCFSFDGRHFCQ